MRARPAWEASAAGSKAARRAKPSTTSCLPSRSSTSASDRPYSGSHVVSEEPFETFRVCKMGQTSYIICSGLQVKHIGIRQSVLYQL